MLFDGSMHQLPDTDPSETQEWLDSLDAVINVHGKVRARYLLSRLLEKAQQSQVSFPATVSTPYVNTIPRDHEPWFPGDEHIERVFYFNRLLIQLFLMLNPGTAAMCAAKAIDISEGENTKCRKSKFVDQKIQ